MFDYCEKLYINIFQYVWLLNGSFMKLISGLGTIGCGKDNLEIENS